MRRIKRITRKVEERKEAGGIFQRKKRRESHYGCAEEEKLGD